KPLYNKTEAGKEAGATTRITLVDCFTAPCEDGCPIRQDIPAYLGLVRSGRYVEALRVICEKNPLPFITGTICSHRCMSCCTRCFYEEPIQIRAAKLLAAENGYEEYAAGLSPAQKRPEKVAVVGGGPAGMAAAHLLARAGAGVTLFEKRAELGGVVRYVIPEFRIDDSRIDRDGYMLNKLGVTVLLNTEAPPAQDLLAAGFSYVVLAIGAWMPRKLALQAGEAQNAISFLEAQKHADQPLCLGRHVAVVGGGNTAMDAARAAKRAKGVERVSLVYRRIRREMPAQAEELNLALLEGVEYHELLAPVAHENGQLLCDVTRLGTAGADGRPVPEATGERVGILADTVISAVGEQVDGEILVRNGVSMNREGRPDGMRHGSVFVIGDAFRGPATVVEGIADAARAAEEILGVKSADHPCRADGQSLKAIRGKLCYSMEPKEEDSRCLKCSVLCENCVDVCPNRANVAIRVPGMEKEQVLHMNRLCNECGNCAVFCPWHGAPYREKWTLFTTEEEFRNCQNQGFFVLDHEAGRVKLRVGDEEYETVLGQDTRTDSALMKITQTVMKEYPWLLIGL
ncbi:MAG: FAD-dependent oxidoreductase, partial [Clostridia bacterium]|nr:FAD-dependent oxidoreductase [Clostridia bacterium]